MLTECGKARTREDGIGAAGQGAQEVGLGLVGVGNGVVKISVPVVQAKGWRRSAL